MKKSPLVIVFILLMGAMGAMYVRGKSGEHTAGASKGMCGKHGLPEAECPFCHKDLVEKKGMCGEHGVPEALCWRCNARLIAAFKAEGDWCAEHGLPESFCTICNPTLARGAAEIPSKNNSAVTVESASNESEPRSRRPPSVTCDTSKLRVHIASAEMAKAANLETVRVERRPISFALSCNAELAYDGNHYARVSSRASGVVQEVKHDVGDRVEKGDVLAVVDSAELAAAKADHLQAQATAILWEQNHSRTHKLLEQAIASQRQDLEAENKVSESRITVARTKAKLRTLGLPDSAIGDLARSEDTSALLPIAAPFAGEIVERWAVVGESTEAARPLFAIADASRMWAELDIYERDAGLVKVGQPLILRPDGLPGESFAGKITWISTQLDAKTRTIRARAELANEQGLLKARMFAHALVTTHDRKPALVIPKSAVQWDGCCNIAFAKESELVYAPRKIRLGLDADDYFEVLDGLTEGETIVTQGSFLLKTEIKKGSIGAGCCEGGGGKK